jgi:predicted KAP-like P-loop ATPase
VWADNETTLDLIGIQVHADLIRSVVTDPSLLPTTIGVFGDWGGGKTSVMKMLQRDLDPESYAEDSEERAQYEGIACLYFNGWLFEGYDDAKSAILSSVLLQLGAHQRFGPRVRDKALSLLESVNWMRLARLGFKEVALPAVLAYLTGGACLLPSIANSAKQLFGAGNAKPADGEDTTTNVSEVNLDELFKADGKTSGPLDVRTFRERFSQMLQESDISSLVILIDDLDRCSPQRIIDNLEAIKLFLSVERTAFVIGADPRIVEHAIATVYSPAETQAETRDRLQRTLEVFES